MELLRARWATGTAVCVGLDSEYEKIPKVVKDGLPIGDAIFAFNKELIQAVADLVCAFKPNIAFYEEHGVQGIEALQRTTKFIREFCPDVPIILDAKRADIGNTNRGYVGMAFDYLGVDAITVHPYLGSEALKPFLDRKDKGIIVLCRTSNPGAGEFQDMEVFIGWGHGRILVQPLYQMIAKRVATEWNTNGNCAVVAGATFPHELQWIRKLVGDMPILIPGVGKQGGDVEAVVKNGADSQGQGMIVNSSSAIIFASSGADFAEAARRETEKLRDAINQYR